MKYEVRLTPESEPVSVEIGEPSGASITAKIGEKTFRADVAQAGSQLSLLVDGHVVDPARARLKASVVNERSLAGGKRAGGGKQDKFVKSPMPGRVVKMSVAPGDSVEVGTPLFVIEAMKMENELRAKASGVVDDVHVTLGQAVEANSKLLTFK